MARRHEAVGLLKTGLSPSQIAGKMGISTASVLGYLYNQVGEGKIRRSDIVFSISLGLRQEIEKLIREKQTINLFTIHRALAKNGNLMDRDDLEIYLALRDARIALGDLYEMTREIEVKLHKAIRAVLVENFGEKEWWRKGIPVTIRQECDARYEEDPEPGAEPYCYSTLINLREILDKNWSIFLEILPNGLGSNKQALLSQIGKLNRIRNKVMHPVRGSLPSEDDFQFVRELRDLLQLDKWIEFA